MNHIFYGLVEKVIAKDDYINVDPDGSQGRIFTVDWNNVPITWFGSLGKFPGIADATDIYQFQNLMKNNLNMKLITMDQKSIISGVQGNDQSKPLLIVKTTYNGSNKTNEKKYYAEKNSSNVFEYKIMGVEKANIDLLPSQIEVINQNECNRNLCEIFPVNNFNVIMKIYFILQYSCTENSTDKTCVAIEANSKNLKTNKEIVQKSWIGRYWWIILGIVIIVLIIGLAIYMRRNENIVVLDSAPSNVPMKVQSRPLPVTYPSIQPTKYIDYPVIQSVKPMSMNYSNPSTVTSYSNPSTITKAIDIIKPDNPKL